ncbi:hypothetical protein [Skermania piniformis]|uniref:Uncharacterized protein n=1 Tax=Skermania pinensis TaxID=39122 RepID=A0ABX8SAL2_9ACTN|nr:hypothetical protein [Skermania piniformis]QXQ14857.1 hypothetical protein KV203_05600 [Skermania piniformis]
MTRPWTTGEIRELLDAAERAGDRAGDRRVRATGSKIMAGVVRKARAYDYLRTALGVDTEGDR